MKIAVNWQNSNHSLLEGVDIKGGKILFTYVNMYESICIKKQNTTGINLKAIINVVAILVDDLLRTSYARRSFDFKKRKKLIQLI